MPFSLGACSAVILGCAAAAEQPVLPAKRTWPAEPAPDDGTLARIVKHIPRLSYRPGGRWPILAWHGGIKTEEALQVWIDRGITPLFLGWHGKSNVSWVLPRFRQLAKQGVPIVVLPQSVVQVMFCPPKPGKQWPPGCDHELPARSTKENHDFACPAWLYENPHLARHAKGFQEACRRYQKEGVEITAILIDFESGAYLRNGAEKEERLRPAMAEALKCPRCLKRFGRDAMDTLQEYSAIVDRARAYATKTCLVDPVAKVFPRAKTGNFYAWPISRMPRAPGMYPAYGYDGSGMNVPQPRRYFNAGWGGCGRDEAKADWNTLWYSLQAFSPCASVLEEGEALVPWIGIVTSRNSVRERRPGGAAYATPEGFAEVVRHLLLRGAETVAVFNTWSDPAVDFPEDYGNIPRKEVGPWIMIMEGVQRGYNDMLRFNEILRQAKPLTYDVAGDRNQLDETATVWSGVATDTIALVRTITFGPEQNSVLEIFGRKVQVPFARKGRFYWITQQGDVMLVAD